MGRGRRSQQEADAANADAPNQTEQQQAADEQPTEQDAATSAASDRPPDQPPEGAAATGDVPDTAEHQRPSDVGTTQEDQPVSERIGEDGNLVGPYHVTEPVYQLDDDGNRTSEAERTDQGDVLYQIVYIDEQGNRLQNGDEGYEPPPEDLIAAYQEQGISLA